LIFHKRSN